MLHDFWHDRWQNNQIGFHQGEANAWLQQFWPALAVAPGSRVFVPLCGKSSDMLWLRAQSYAIVGVEISRLAVEAFFAENGMPVTVSTQGEFSVYESDGIRLYCGDYFALTAQHLDGVCAVFDRASLIALPPEMRAGYARHMRQLLPPGSQTLLVAFEYPQAEMQGPPFSVQEEEVRALYAAHCDITLLHVADILAQEPRFRDKGLSRLQEKVYALTYN
ncbi:MAG TPA: thiopurine S-methyltransferase [Methylophilaceae bacterium]|nr:thiopurine S-methyltransferase [Methylophilaceae bacterium]HQR60640.1 thiopurine S-methyltransferase [Methylophilaceae bacterium]